MTDNKKTNSVLLINDMAGYGKVALSVMIPIFSHLGYETYNLPTALVSNTLDYGKFDILDTTGYMQNTLNVWEQLGFSYDAVCTGFIVSGRQSELIYEYCRKQKEKGAAVFVDPIMGDDGHLYNGVSPAAIGYMKRLCGIADVIIPNITEACFIAGLPAEQTSYGEADIAALLDCLQQNGAKSVVITSVPMEGEMYTVVKNHGEEGWLKLPYTEIPVRFPGTGDIFTSIVTGCCLKGGSLENAVRKAMDTVVKLITANFGNADKYKGIPIEQYLDDIEC